MSISFCHSVSPQAWCWMMFEPPRDMWHTLRIGCESISSEWTTDSEAERTIQQEQVGSRGIIEETGQHRKTSKKRLKKFILWLNMFFFQITFHEFSGENEQLSTFFCFGMDTNLETCQLYVHVIPECQQLPLRRSKIEGSERSAPGVCGTGCSLDSFWKNH